MTFIGAARRVFTGAVAGALALTGLVILTQAPALADTAPAPGTPATVSADALPTWQINGVAWNQVVVGNTVYVVGSFTAARPPGSAAGQNEVPASNIFAYDITTGNRVPSFSHSLNAQGLGITKSPDGSLIYVVGDFTSVDGVARNHVAAFNTATGAMTSFAPSANGKVSGVAATGSSVWLGGNFSKVNNVTKGRLASVKASDGSLLPFNATVDDRPVGVMVLTPDNTGLVIGGMFQSVNGQTASGMASVDAVTGATRPWAINQLVKDGGTASGILSLSADANNIYGSGYAFGSGNFEGSFAANPSTGAVVFTNDCHGDTYGTFPIGQVLYTVSHVHDCRWIGGFPQTDSQWSINQRKAVAFSITPSTTNTGPDNYGWNYNGQPATSVLQWFPELSFGTYTPSGQAGWSVTGNDKYVALGGEFPKVNNVAQQGLTRFGVSSVSTNKRGPAKVTATASPNPAIVAPSAASLTPGTARVSWQAAVDPDNNTLTYNVYRSGTAAPVYTTTQNSNFWTYPTMGFKDTGLTLGNSYTYTIRASDPFGNLLTVGTASVTVSGTAPTAYSSDVTGDGATAFWRLGESSGPTVYDYAGFNDATASSGVGRGAAGAIGGDSDGASTFSGDNTGLVVSPSMATTPDFTVEAWVKTNTTRGGKIIGYGGSNSGQSGSYDRHVYMDNAGHIIFGVYPGGVRTISSGTKTYNDNQWHHIVASQSSTDGIALYIDGTKASSDASVKTAQDYAGFWRIGGDNLGGWPNQPTSLYINGTIDDVAVYPTALSLAKVRTHYTDSGRSLGGPAAPTDTYGKAIVQDAPDLYWRLGETAGNTAVDVSGNQFDGVYSGGYTLGRQGAVAGTTDKAVKFDGSSGTVASAATVTNPTNYTEELWFNTTTMHGGKLVGLGNAQSGTSSNYDRHVYMENSGKLTFGVWTGQTNTITSPDTYNNGEWHHMVATQSSTDGMKLYVDGALVGTNAQTGAQDYTGYWRVGGDTAWGGDSPFFDGIIDEVSIYSKVISAATVSAHYQAGGGQLANVKPTAAFSSTTTGRVAHLDGTGSSDSDGTIASYDWDFGDGTAHGSGSSPDHTYGADDTYTVILKVTDDRGGVDTISHDVTVANAKPTASFSHSEDLLQVSVDGSNSSDTDGTVSSYSWNWGDNTADGSGITANHTYGSVGTYTVVLTVTDNNGGTDTISHDVTASSNQAPTARFTSTIDLLKVSVDGSTSSDPDGNVASYSWHWDDGTPDSSGATPQHTYGAAGTYTIALTVTDNRGGTDVVTHDVTVAANQPPTAAFTSTASDLGLTVNGSTSSDPDGTIASYAWQWGDNTPDSSGATPAQHTYGATGTYSVKLTVTDNRGATDSITKDITVTAPAGPTTLASDAFGRTVASGWGAADLGGTWVPKSGAASFSVGAGVGSITVGAGVTRQIVLGGASSSSTDTTVTFSSRNAPTGGGLYGTVIGREVAAGGGYRATVLLKANGTAYLYIVKRTAAGGDTNVAPGVNIPGTFTPAGGKVNVRLVVSGDGTTTLKAKVWFGAAAEPAAWAINTTDSTAGYQGAGKVGVMAYLSASATDTPAILDVDNLVTKTAE